MIIAVNECGLGWHQYLQFYHLCCGQDKGEPQSRYTNQYLPQRLQHSHPHSRKDFLLGLLESRLLGVHTLEIVYGCRLIRSSCLSSRFNGRWKLLLLTFPLRMVTSIDCESTVLIKKRARPSQVSSPLVASFRYAPLLSFFSRFAISTC